MKNEVTRPSLEKSEVGEVEHRPEPEVTSADKPEMTSADKPEMKNLEVKDAPEAKDEKQDPVKTAAEQESSTDKQRGQKETTTTTSTTTTTATATTTATTTTTATISASNPEQDKNETKKSKPLIFDSDENFSQIRTREEGVVSIPFGEMKRFQSLNVLGSYFKLV